MKPTSEDGLHGINNGGWQMRIRFANADNYQGKIVHAISISGHVQEVLAALTIRRSVRMGVKRPDRVVAFKCNLNLIACIVRLREECILIQKLCRKIVGCT